MHPFMDAKGDRCACLGEPHTLLSKKAFLPFFSALPNGCIPLCKNGEINGRTWWKWRKTWQLYSISRLDQGSSSVSDFTSFLDGIPTYQSQHDGEELRAKREESPSPVQTPVKEGHEALCGIFLFHFCVPRLPFNPFYFWLLLLFLSEIS